MILVSTYLHVSRILIMDCYRFMRIESDHKIKIEGIRPGFSESV